MAEEISKFKRAFASRIRAEREKRGLTSTNVANMLGMTPIGYKYYERGQRMPTFEKAFEIWKILGVSFEQIEHLINLYEAIERED